MENAGEEPLPLLDVVFERTTGGTWGHVNMVGHILYAIFVFAMARRIHAVWLVVATDVANKAYFSHS